MDEQTGADRGPSSAAVADGQELWRPSPARVEATQLDRFRRRHRPEAGDSAALLRWSVDEPGPFWRALWEWSAVLGDPGRADVETGASLADTRFLPEARLNLAENLLADRPGNDPIAVVAAAEDGSQLEMTWQQLREETAAMAAWLLAAGIGPGDRVAAWMPHRVETIVAFLAAASIGAVFTSTSSDFGVDGVVDRFGQTEPRVLVASDGYRYGGRTFPLGDRLVEIAAALPSLERILVVEAIDAGSAASIRDDVGAAASIRDDVDADVDVAVTEGGPTIESWEDAVGRHRGVAPHYERLPGDHPLYILYSSGTTGKPKCIVHRTAGVLLKHLSEQRLHCDIGPGDRVFFFTTCGWMMWNWLVGCLASGATIVCYDGNPNHPGPAALFELAERTGATLFGVSAKYIDALMKSGYRPRDHQELTSIRTVCSTGSPLGPEGFAWVYDSIGPDLHLASISGGTDLCGCLVLGDPTRPVHAGEIQGPALGLDIAVFDENGRAVEPGVKGELVCRTPFPSMPLRFWGDDDGSRYRSAYYERFPGVWAHGDYASWTDRGGMVIHGRSDATLNASGVRIGTAEIYRVVEQLPEVQEAIAVAQEWDGDTRIVLFVRTSDGVAVDDDLVATIRAELRSRCSPRHVPAKVLGVADIPRTRSGKIVELAVTEVIHGRPVTNIEALANADALDQFTGRPELG